MRPTDAASAGPNPPRETSGVTRPRPIGCSGTTAPTCRRRLGPPTGASPRQSKPFGHGLAHRQPHRGGLANRPDPADALGRRAGLSGDSFDTEPLEAEQKMSALRDPRRDLRGRILARCAQGFDEAFRLDAGPHLIKSVDAQDNTSMQPRRSHYWPPAA